MSASAFSCKLGRELIEEAARALLARIGPIETVEESALLRVDEQRAVGPTNRRPFDSGVAHAANTTTG
jgi:hypothetical protein